MRCYQGFGKVVGVNALAPFYLAHLLMGQLRAGAPSRVVNVVSHAEMFGRIHWHDLG